VQWFVFAALALLIYAILLRRRWRAVAPAGPRR
jgi:cytochrome oxidase assembly protein ShyY1